MLLSVFMRALVLAGLLLSPASANDSICPTKPAATDPCTPVNDWTRLKAIVEGAVGAVVLCPFDIVKSDSDPIVLTKATTVMCRKANENDECTIRGGGEHIRSISTTEVAIVGLSFHESDEHAVYIQNSVPTNTHTFCDCTFENNKRLDGKRGGAFMTEKGSGKVNVVGCTFRQNYCASYGGALYTRSNFTNIENSTFIGNVAAGPGGAILAAKYADLAIKGSLFSGNNGENTFAIVVKPLPGPMVTIDGGDNLSVNNGDCDGFYDWSALNCTEFVTGPLTTPVPSSSPSTSAPSFSAVPSSAPSYIPTQAPTVSAAPSATPTISMAPTSVVYSFCGDLEQYQDQDCLSVDSWSDFVSAIASASGIIMFCAFTIKNDTDEPVIVDKDINMHCPTRSCVIYGPSTHLRVEGDTQTVVSGFTFTGSQRTAVQVRTESYSSVTTFCKCRFIRNERYDDGGGAIRTTDDAGEVNIAECVFYRNAGTMGGAIFSRAFRLNIVSTNMTQNEATITGGSIYMNRHAHLLVRGSTFSGNRAADKYSIAVLPSGNSTGFDGTFVDAGGNAVDKDGHCGGFYVKAKGECRKFVAQPAAPTLVYPYVPGELSVYDSNTGLLLSSGLSARQLAKAGEPVAFGSAQASESASSLPFHKEPDGAAVVATEDGGWLYISNSEQSIQPIRGTGGVYALVFDSEGEIRDYRMLLSNTTRNCNGGLTPWDTWVSCEEVAGGQCWQVDPHGLRTPEITSIGEEAGGNFEAFTYDIRNASRPCYFITEDHERGALRRWCPDSYLLSGDRWSQLHGNGTRDYLKFINGTNKFEWTPDLEEGRQSAQDFYPFTEGISHDGAGILYFVSKRLKALFTCNLDTFEYRIESTDDKSLLFGDGSFSAEPDHVLHSGTDDVLYFTEDAGHPGVYGKRKSTGEYFAIMEGQHEMYLHDEATGLAWSRDWTRIYVCIQDKGVLFEVTRDDGLPFDHDVSQLHLKYHAQS